MTHCRRVTTIKAQQPQQEQILIVTRYNKNNVLHTHLRNKDCSEPFFKRKSMCQFSINKYNYLYILIWLNLCLSSYLLSAVNGQSQTVVTGHGISTGLSQTSAANRLTVFPRRRSSALDGSAQMQSRAVDTRAQLEVLEGQPRGTVVGIIPTKPEFTYRFNEPPLEFTLDQVTGEIKTNMVLDREDMCDRYDLVVLSSQPTYPIEVRITVLDINDNSPEFPESSIAVSFSESAAAGTRLLLDAATDRDIGENGVTDDYCIIDGNYDNKFRLAVTTNPTGDVSYLHLETTGNLDRESIGYYQLNISARDNGNPPKYGYLQVNVTILDVNDNPPIFDHSDYIVSLNESVPPGTIVLQVMASDNDLGDNSKITYYLDSAGLNGEHQFTVDPETGVISTTDYLKCPQSCVFTVYARDHGSPRQDGRTYVTVNLVDANDHDPIIQFQYVSGLGNYATVDENAVNGSIVAAISILDKDEGSNGEASVRIVAGNELGHFALNNNIVSVNGVLDREELSKYNLTIVATDKGNPPRSATAHLSIHVNDVNDHEPVFEKSEYSAVLSELAPIGSYIAAITATDEDTGVNAQIYYDFVSGNKLQWFVIDAATGLITTAASLDREVQGSVELNISARDGGPNPKWAYTQLKVTILDENDEAPRFLQQHINVSLSESRPTQTLIAMLTAADHDQGTNGSVTYTLPRIVERKYPQQFSLDSLTGELTTRRLLDRELIANYEIFVVARDQGTPPQSSTATVYLTLEDVNDNDPVFYPELYFYALNDEPLDNLSQPLLKVTASDRDVGNNALITYKLESGGDGFFAIDSLTGAIMLRSNALAGDIRQAHKELYKLNISAKDQGNRRSRKDAIVEIILQSKLESLEFDVYESYEFQITEDAFGGTVKPRDVGRVQVKSLANNIEYAIVAGDTAHNFAINSHTGLITTQNNIDREIQAQYQLIVMARLNLAYGKCLVHIAINDLNDNAPMFAEQDRDSEILLPENAAVGQAVYLSRAYDSDADNNSRLRYALSHNPEQQFRIDSETGVIYLQKPVRAEPETIWNIEITATDHGHIPLATKHNIVVNIADVNDHTPVFDHTSYETSLLESTKVNTRFFALPASDADLALNALISYEIMEGNAELKFGIFPDGYLFVRAALDREERDYYALTVACRDAGSPARSSNVPVIIHVIDENDNAPQFTNNTFTLSIAENEPADSFVGKLTANDRDIGRNAELIYSLATQTQHFSIDARHGFIKTLHEFDREALVMPSLNMPQSDANYIMLEALVTDNGIKRLNDKVKVKVIVTDVNDNAPQFVRAPYRVQISEGASLGTQLLRVHALDADEHLNGLVFYALTEGNQKNRFALDAATGQLTLTQSLDREKQQMHVLTVLARDNAQMETQLSSSTTISIEVLDENDCAPEFAQTSSEISVLEITAANTELMRFRANDMDVGVNSQVTFSITAGNRRDTFHIDALTGSLYLHKMLDYEETTAYILNITASDGGTPRLSTTISFHVQVVDENDNPPSFPNTAIVRQIREGIALHTPIVTVMAEDPDAGLNGKVKYAIVKQEPELAGGWHFGINDTTGVIHTLRDIDRETIDTFRLTVVAKDQAQLPDIQLTAEKLVTVIVEDVNDNSPIFVSMNAAILPKAVEGALVMQVQARDSDSASNGLVTYELMTLNTDLFQLQRNTGALTLRKTIVNPLPRYHLALKATDEAVQNERKSTEAYITIITKNREENNLNSGPVFDQRELSGSVYENEPIGTSILTVNARFNSSAIEYYVTNTKSLNSNKQVDRLFDIDTKLGILSTVKELDREAGPDTFEVEVYAIAVTDNTPHTTSTNVKVTVLDRNDSPPVFKGTPYNFNVSEDLGIGHKIATLVAEDPDTLGTLSFKLVDEKDGKFQIESETGKLRLKDSLDRETKSQYKLLVRVSDGVQHTDVIVTIEVTDTNDNPPIFDETVYSFDIPEDAPRGFQVGVITATDPDLGNNAQVSYSVISGWATDMFSLNPQTGVFTLTAQLDYEEIQHFIFVVQAQDNGHPSLSTTITVYCNVLDLNDNAPVFDPMSYSNEILEDVPVGHSVITVTASDLDSGENGHIEYNIISGDENNDFNISANGIIRTRRELDRETKSSYNLIITATDCAPEFLYYMPAMNIDQLHQHQLQQQQRQLQQQQQQMQQQKQQPYYLQRRQRQYRQHQYVKLQQQQQLQPQQRLSSTVQLTITLKDVNDEAPTFISTNETSILENIAINTVVMAIKAIDKDEGRNSYVEYKLHSYADEEKLPFSLGQNDGLLRVAERLDRELRSTYLLNITASDRGDPPQTTYTQILVKVLDENDNSPVFDPRLYSASVAENASIGAMVLQVSATDIDEGANGRVRYSIASGDTNRDFSISEDSGVVRVAKNLNYERRARYVLTVVAEDCAADVGAVLLNSQNKVSLSARESRYDTAELAIVITDINDNPPTFLDSPYVAYVMENVLPPQGGYVLTVNAYDADSPPFNSQVRYFLKEGDAELFRINASTGEISLLRTMDREQQAEYTLTLVAMDTGSPPLTGTGIVRVIVQDMNDHSPEFERQTYHGSVKENLPIGSKVLQISATDKDDGLNAEVRYILEGEKKQRFAINAQTGEITTAAVLDREETAIYHLVVQAADNSATEPRSTSVNLTIMVLDENDNAPVFSANNFNVNVPDRLERDEFVFGANALDIDSDENALLAYNITGKDVHKFFYINAATGIIKTKQRLTNNENSEFSIVLLATDSGKPTKSSMANLKIILRPTSMFPVFSNMPTTQFMLSEDVMEGKLITQILASSPKKSLAGNIKFSIAGGNIGESVYIDAKTGMVSVGKNGLDYEKAHQYDIWIEASDSDVPALRSVMLLTINVTDANDNAPVFDKFIYNAEVLEEELPPQTIVKVKAMDQDSGDNGEISYRLVNDFEGSFEIDADSGEIYTTMRLDREEISHYDIVVEALDQGVSQLTGTATVLLTLLDKNDNPPKFTRLFSVNVTENAELDSFVIQVTSSDLDVGINANATYSITENPGNKFLLDPINGNVTVAGYLDREQQDEYLLKIVVSDGAWRAETPITITIQDQNDNAPEFEHSYYSFNFPELQRSIQLVGQVIATDRDKQGPNSVISYSLQHPSDLFTIDPATGEIFSKRSIKYKHSQFQSSPENMYSLQVLATDNGKPPLYSECLVHINIVDSNNNAPKFLQRNYLSAVPAKSKTGQRVIKVQAVDKLDYGVNAEIDYSLVGGNATGYFKIDKHEGWITVANMLDVAAGTKFIITVKAVDRGVPPQSDEVFVSVIATGENLYPPEFMSLSYQVSVQENEPIGTAILTVSANDKDEGPNGMLQYEISGSEEFTVNKDTGDIIVHKSLDYDSIQEYYFNITVKDLAYHPKSAVAMVTVLLKDVNDNPPVFNQTEYYAFIPENKPAGTFVYKALATDMDSPQFAVIRYSIIGGSGKHMFDINKTTGEIVSSVPFDYEVHREYNLQIRASNPDSFMQNTCLVRVYITGVNEFYPRFSKPAYHFDVSETSDVGTIVGVLEATDKDAGPDGEIYYILLDAGNDYGFSMHKQTGVLRVSRHLDRETESRVALTVIAKNYGSIRGGDFDEAQIIISIQDGNDPPEFLKSLYSASISEAASVGTSIIAVQAIDRDVRAQNNQFSYSIIDGNINQAFKIDAVTGEIETFKQLDREQVALYNLTVGAIDTGLPPQTGRATVQITLEDINDNGPNFEPSELIGYILENEPSGISIMTLQAHDKDLPPNGAPFTYKLIGGKHMSYLNIDRNTGVVKSTRSYDREQTAILEALIEVEDSGVPKQSAQHVLTIKVLDQNDNPSTSRTVHIVIYAYNNKIPIAQVADVHPNDSDVVGNYKCRFVPHTKSSPLGVFSIYDACYVHTTYQTAFKDYTYSVSGDDGKHGDVISTVSFSIKRFDADTLENSITVMLSNVTAEHFLEHYYRIFVDLVSNSLDADDMLILYSVRNSVANTTQTELSLAIENSSRGYRKPAYVVERLTKKRLALEKLLQPNIRVVIGYNPCNNANSCENGGFCSAAIEISENEQDLTIIDSPMLIFTSPQIVHDYVCKCPDGFIGQQCDKREDPCLPNPCQADGQCRRIGYEFECVCAANREGKYCQLERSDACSINPCRNGGSCRRSSDRNFFCICRTGYRGNQCEQVTDACRPNPCLHGGVCVNLKPNFKCNCPDGRYGKICDKSTFGFPELSYMAFPPLDAVNNDISIIFATTKPDALLLYNYGAQLGGRSDFVAIELIKGKAFFSFGGARTAITTVVVAANSNYNLADGNWHKITATRNRRVMSLSIANCTDNGETCKDCKHGDPACYTDDIGPVDALNFNKHYMLIGGLSSADSVLERPGQIHTDDLVGCVHSVFINGRLMNMSNPIKERGVLPTCQRNNNGGPCQQSSNTHNSVCGTHGSCLDRWNFALCDCGGQLYSPDCFNSLQPITLMEGAFIEFKISEKHRRMQLLDNFYGGNSLWSYDVQRQARFAPNPDNLTALAQTLEAQKSLSLMFRTYKTEGLLIYAATNKHYSAVELRMGKIIYQSKQTNFVNMSSQQNVAINDGNWHNLTIHVSNRVLRLLVDGEKIGEELDYAGVHDFLDPYLTALSIGGVKAETAVMEYVSFEGCLANFTINNEVQSFNNSITSSVFREVYLHGKVLEGCAHNIGIGAAQVADPISIGLTLVIVFFVILVVAIIGSYIIYRFRGKPEKSLGNLSCGVPGFKIKHPAAATILGGAVGTQNQADHVLTRGVHGNENAQLGYHNDNGDLIRSVPGHHLVGPELISKKFKEREIGNPDPQQQQQQQQRTQRPDIIEREVVSKNSPLREEHHQHVAALNQSHHLHDRANSVDLGSDYPEHYDLENASSIAPSDIDIVYHYNRYREAGGVRKYKATPPPVASYTHHKHPAATAQTHRHSPRHVVGASFIPRAPPPQASQQPPPTSTSRPHQSTPLARLSPSSELSSQQPRILTLQDISGKPLQSALLATTSSSGGVGKDVMHSNSERSLNSPVMSQLSGQSSNNSHQKNAGVPAPSATQTAISLTAEEIERLNVRPRTSSLVSTLDAVSSSSEVPHVSNGHLALGGGLHPTDVDAHSSTSTDESGNDSFTCSEIEYDNNSLSGDVNKYQSNKSVNDSNVVNDRVGVGRESVVGVGKVPPLPRHAYDGFDSSFRGSLSTLVASDDDLSTHIGLYRGQPNGTASPSSTTLGWDYLLNWGPNFESLVGVFRDIAELPDSVNDQHVTTALRLPNNVQKASEEYV